MARRATGRIIETAGRDGRTYRALRFTAYGKRRYLSLGPVTRTEAEAELRHVLADVERGTWEPAAAPTPPPEVTIPTFHEYAARWWQLNEGRLGERTRTDYLWRMDHLLPTFAAKRLDEITYDDVEGYIAAKLAEGVLGASSINKTIKLMAQVLDGAVERDLIGRNPAKGKDRRLRERAPRRTYLDTAAQIDALLRAGATLDRNAQTQYRHVERKAILTVFAFAGLRIGELCALRWADVDLAAGWLHVGDAKTDAGRRRIKLRGALRDELAAVKARARYAEPGHHVFASAKGTAPSIDNVRSRVVNAAVKQANETADEAAEKGKAAVHLPAGITPHSLRRTFASLLYALGENPAVVMAEMGHTDPGLALRIYAQAMRRDEAEVAQLRALVDGATLTEVGEPSTMRAAA